MPGAPLDELPGWALNLLRSAPVARLGMLDADDRPRVLPVTFAMSDGELWSAVDHKPKRQPRAELARVRFLRRRSEAAICVDRYDDDWSRLAWVQALGRVQVVEDEAAAAHAIAALERKYAQYRARRPAGPFLQLAVERALCWRAGG